MKMVDITEATMRGGLGDCLKATLDKDNLPTYVGLGGGLIAGNAVGKKLQSWYDTSLDVGAVPNKWVQLAARTAGRLATSGVICAVSGSLEGSVKETAQMAAVGSTGFVAIDAVRTFGQDPGVPDPSWIDDYLTLQVPTRRAVRVSRVSRAAPRPVALQDGRPAMESAALQPQGVMTRAASLRV
jgi:hypothetical protein